MPVPASTLISDILVRVRDPGGVATTRAQVLDLLDRCQIILVRMTGSLLRDRNITTTEDQLIYPIDPAETLRIAYIYNANTNRRLSRMRWSQLIQADTQWWRTTHTDGPTSWAPLGTDHYILYPGAESTPRLLTLREQQRPTKLDTEDVELDLPYEHHPKLLDLVELLLLLRNREDTVSTALSLLEAAHGQS